MNKNLVKFREYSIISVFVTVLVIILYFYQNLGYTFWIVLGFVLAIWYLYSIPIFEYRYSRLPVKLFIRKIFYVGTVYRLISMLLIHLETKIIAGHEQYVGAMDAQKYDQFAGIISDMILSGNWNVFEFIYTGIAEKSLDDTGYFLILGLLHLLFFDSTLFVKIVLVLINSYMTVLIYKISRNYFNEKISRLAGIMMMIFPLSFFYGSVYLKESFITFILVYIIYLLSSAGKYKLQLKNIVFLILLLLSLFLMRTAVAMLAISILFVWLLQFKKQFKLQNKIIVFGSLIAILIILTYFMDYGFFLGKISSGDTYGSSRLEKISTSGVSLFTFVSYPLFYLLSYIAPFPNFVFIDLGLDLPHLPDDYLIGGVLVWNMIAPMSIIGLIRIIKLGFFKYILVWYLPVTYLFLLTITALFTSERFQYTSMPLMLILASIGINDKKYTKYWIPLFILSVFLIVAWNYFRLKSRGII